MAKSDWKIEHIDNVPPMKDTFSKGWKSIRWHLDIDAFGVNGVTKPKGEWLTPIHDERNENQDELFIVMEGEVEFYLNNKKKSAAAGTLISVKPNVRRGALSLKTPTTIIIIGSPIGRVYSPPNWA